MNHVLRACAFRALAVFIILAAVAPQGSAGAKDEQPLSIELKAAAWTGDLDALAERRAIRVLVPYSKTLYFVDLGGVQRGISYDFMHAFVRALRRPRCRR